MSKLSMTVHKSQAFTDSEQLPDLNAIVDEYRFIVPADVEVHIRWGECENDAYAECHSCLELNRLFIRVSPPDYNPDLSDEFGIPRDVTSDVVHELVHYGMEPLKPKRGTLAYRLWESQVERIAQNYLKLKRGEV